VVSVPEDFHLRRGLVAMTGDGMVGRAVDVAPGTGMARVLLLDDPASRVPVMLETAKTRAILSGQGNGILMLEHLPDGTVPVVGDRILTAGDDGVLPSGLPLARITRVDGDRIWAAPIAQLDRLDWLRLVDFGTINTLAKPNFQAP
jgi:rod shape-determining protein MreC